MKLADLRALSIRKHLKIRFPVSNGLECVVTDEGIAQVPGLARVPDFNLEQELASASDFVLETVGGDPKRPTPPQRVRREELAAMTNASVGAAAGQESDE